MLHMLKENMEKYLTDIWITCLDKYMLFWFNNYTCPGFMFIPCKAWTFGNEYHTIYCGLLGILFGLELVKGKNCPKELGKPAYNGNSGDTCGLLLITTRKCLGDSAVQVSRYCSESLNLPTCC